MGQNKIFNQIISKTFKLPLLYDPLWNYLKKRHLLQYYRAEILESQEKNSRLQTQQDGFL
jgi:hypothetical protein